MLVAVFFEKILQSLESWGRGNESSSAYFLDHASFSSDEVRVSDLTRNLSHLTENYMYMYM